MNLQDQVCTIEQAKKLRELGVRQESYFVIMADGEIIHREQDKRITDIADFLNSDWYACFSVAELGIMIGSGYYTYQGQNGLEWVCYNENDVYEMNGERYSTEAQARAALLIHLIENKIVEVSEINDRLNK